MQFWEQNKVLEKLKKMLPVRIEIYDKGTTTCDMIENSVVTSQEVGSTQAIGVMSLVPGEDFLSEETDRPAKAQVSTGTNMDGVFKQQKLW